MNILVLSGLDPSGGAGLLRDVNTIESLYTNTTPVHAFGVITLLTAQNTSVITSVKAVDTEFIWQQVATLHAEYTIDVIKIGVIDDAHLSVIERIINMLNVPVVLDPVICSSSTHDFANLNALRALLPKCSIITPNYAELMMLTGAESVSEAVAKIESKYLLLTTTDVSEGEITHQLYRGNMHLNSYTYAKLAHNYHGSGCTLASFLAVKYLQYDIQTACKHALDDTYQTLVRANFGGARQLHPNVKQ